MPHGYLLLVSGGDHRLLGASSNIRALFGSPVEDLLNCRLRGINVIDIVSFLERETGRVDLATTNPSFLIFSDGFSAGQRIGKVSKRLFDIFASLLVLVIGLPLGLWDDLFSGQPMGSGILLWSLATIGMDFIETRFPWRGFLTNWLVASGVIAALWKALRPVRSIR